MTGSKTPFAGYERLAPGDPLSEDGYAFQFQNPVIADRLGKLGAVTHRHDAHAAMVDPTTAPTVVTAATGGSIPASTPIHVVYTLTDPDGGETLPVSAIVVTTATGYLTPAAPPTVAADYTAGSLLAGTPLYAITVTDGAGGETALGPAASLTINPGHANARAQISGLTALTNASSGSSVAASWRLWKSVDGGSSWNLMGTAAYSVNTFTDSGGGGDCTVSPPRTGTTVGTNKLTVTIPATSQPAEATFFSIYASVTGQFLTPSLLGTYPVSDFGSAKVYTALTLLNAQPPAVSSCYPGANQIDPDTDILNNPWKTAVANAAALPSSGNTDGDVRETLDNHSPHVWTGSAWASFGGSGAGSPVVRKFAFAYNTSGLRTGAALYTPTIGDLLLDAWIEIDTAWDGTTPLGDFGAFAGGATGGLFNDFSLSGLTPDALDMTRADLVVQTNSLIGDQSSRLSDYATAWVVFKMFQTAAIASVPSTQQDLAVNAGAIAAGARLLPLKFATADPINVVVSQDGSNTGADPGSTQGAAVLYLVTATPV